MTATRRDRRALLKPLALLGVVTALLLVVVSEAQPVRAATITVNSADDELNSDGDCSLITGTAWEAYPGQG